MKTDLPTGIYTDGASFYGVDPEGELRLGIFSLTDEKPQNLERMDVSHPSLPDVKPPQTCWAIIRFDPKIDEKRIIDIYVNAEDASLDATMFGPAFVEVEPFLIHHAPQYSNSEPAYEETADDFDTPIHVSGEVR